MNEHTSDPEEFRLVMETISQTIPDLLEKVNKILFEGQDGAKVGNSVAAFHSALVESGIPADQAFNLTSSFISNLQGDPFLGPQVQIVD